MFEITNLESSSVLAPQFQLVYTICIYMHILHVYNMYTHITYCKPIVYNIYIYTHTLLQIANLSFIYIHMYYLLPTYCLLLLP